MKKAAKKKAAKKVTKKKAKKKTKTEKKSTKKTKGGKKVLSFADRQRKIRARDYDNPVVIYEDDPEPPRAATRFVKLNCLLGEGGIKRGSIVEVYGPEDAGKSSFGVALIADIQAQAPPEKNKVVLVNYEEHQDYEWWRTLGLKTDSVHFIQLRPLSLEEGVADMVDLVESGEVCAVMIDSVFAAKPKDAKEGIKAWANRSKKGSQGIGLGLSARQWGVAWTAVKGLFVEHDVICIAVNQIRALINTTHRPKGAGPATTTPGGKALKFYSWIRLDLRGGALMDADGELRHDVDGRRVRVRVVKNKTSGEARGIAYYDLVRGHGWDLTSELIQVSLECGAITHKGGGHYVCGKKKIRGKAALREWVEGSEHVRSVLTKVVERFLASSLDQDPDMEGKIGEDD